MKVSKTVKDANPKIYGYGSLEQLEADPSRFGDDPDNPLTNWVPYKDADGDLRLIPCAEEYYHFHRNEKRNEARRKDVESRCMISSEKYGLVKCRKDCESCEYSRNGKAVSIDYMAETYDYEFPDGLYETECKKRDIEERDGHMWSLISEMEEVDQKILKLYNEGRTDQAIARVVNKSRSTVQERRVKLVEMLKKQLKKIGY